MGLRCFSSTVNRNMAALCRILHSSVIVDTSLSYVRPSSTIPFRVSSCTCLCTYPSNSKSNAVAGMQPMQCSLKMLRSKAESFSNHPSSTGISRGRSVPTLGKLHASAHASGVSYFSGTAFSCKRTRESTPCVLRILLQHRHYSSDESNCG
jgi:hypothetical protein